MTVTAFGVDHRIEVQRHDGLLADSYHEADASARRARLGRREGCRRRRSLPLPRAPGRRRALSRGALAVRRRARGDHPAHRSKAVRCPWSPRTRTSRTLLGPNREARRARGWIRTTPAATGRTPPRRPCSRFAAPTPSTKAPPQGATNGLLRDIRRRVAAATIDVQNVRSPRGSLAMTPRRARAAFRFATPRATRAASTLRSRRRRNRDGRYNSSPPRTCTSSSSW